MKTNHNNVNASIYEKPGVALKIFGEQSNQSKIERIYAPLVQTIRK